MYYKFVRIHQTLRITPAMAAGVTDRVWEIADIVRLLEDKKPAVQASPTRFSKCAEQRHPTGGVSLGHRDERSRDGNER